MARARNIKPSFFTNEELVELPFEDRLLFIGLWTLADREGRLEDRPKRIKMAIFPADTIDVDVCLERLSGAWFIARYEADGIKCIQVLNFTKHQNPHVKEAASELPGMGLSSASTVQAQCKNSASHADSLIPDSLIPESSLRSDGAQGAPPIDEQSGTKRKTSGPPTRAKQLPAEFVPDETAVALAAELGVHLASELPKFRDYHIARGKPMKDWQAALRTWLRNAKTFGSRSPPTAGREESRRIAASTRLSDYREACASEKDRDDERTIEATAPARLLG